MVGDDNVSAVKPLSRLAFESVVDQLAVVEPAQEDLEKHGERV